MNQLKNGNLGRAYAILIDLALSNLTLPETIAEIDRVGLQLEVCDNELILHSDQPPPAYLKNAIEAHKPQLLKYVAAMPGQCWPTKERTNDNGW